MESKRIWLWGQKDLYLSHEKIHFFLLLSFPYPGRLFCGCLCCATQKLTTSPYGATPPKKKYSFTFLSFCLLETFPIFSCFTCLEKLSGLPYAVFKTIYSWSWLGFPWEEKGPVPGQVYSPDTRGEGPSLIFLWCPVRVHSHGSGPLSGSGCSPSARLLV